MRKRAIAAALACLLALPGITGQAPRAAADHTYNMSYIYFGSPSTYARQVERTGKTLSAVSPNYFDIKEDGLLDVTWKLSSSFIDWSSSLLISNSSVVDLSSSLIDCNSSFEAVNS